MKKSTKIVLIVLAILVIGIALLFIFFPKAKDKVSSIVNPSSSSTAKNIKTTLLTGQYTQDGFTIFGKNIFRSLAPRTQGESALVAQLPKNIKRIKLSSPSQILFVNNVSTTTDYGEGISILDVTSNKVSPLYTSSEGFRIDDYKLSPDKKLLAIWEVKYAEGQSNLTGGQSRIVELTLADKKWRTILGPQTVKAKSGTVDDAFQNLADGYFVQYPLFYDNQNNLYLDTYSPEGGWNNGLYKIAATDKKMALLYPAGSYSIDGTDTSPVISGDGKLIAITRPDQNFEPTRTGANLAISNGNKLSYVDTTTGKEVGVFGDGSKIIKYPLFSEDGSKLAFVVYSKEDLSSGTIYSYDMTKKVAISVRPLDKNYWPVALVGLDNATKVSFWQKALPIAFAETPSDLSVLAINKGTDADAISNVGEKYLPVGADSTLIPLDKSWPVAQVNSSSLYINTVTAEETPSTAPTTSSASSTEAASSLAVKTSAAKGSGIGISSVTPVQNPNPNKVQRTNQQQARKNYGGLVNTDPKLIEDCNKILPGFKTAKTSAEMLDIIEKSVLYKNLGAGCQRQWQSMKATGQNKLTESTWDSFLIGWDQKCWPCLFGADTQGGGLCAGVLDKETSKLAEKCLTVVSNPCLDESYGGVKTENTMKCADSPLYLYPQRTQHVSIYSDAGAYRTSPALDSGSVWNLTASPDGKLISSDGTAYDKISYDYVANPAPLSNGIIANQANLKEKLAWYASRLGLNQKETSDFVDFWTEKLKDAPFVQISHYSRLESERLTRLTIDPKPDTFIPIVMYFKKLDYPVSLQSPVFEPIQERKGFTALDWSGVVD